MSARTYDLVLFGATGYTGGLTAEYLARHMPASARWALAGRNPSKLEAVRRHLSAINPACSGLALLVTDAEDPDPLRQVVDATRVMITTVGPYLLHGEPLVAVCAATGTDYVDLTGEPEFVDLMWLRYHAQAQESGARLVHCCGFDSLPADLGCWFTVEQLPEHVPITVKGFVRAEGGFSGGTYHSAIHALARVREYHRVRKERKAREVWPVSRRIGSTKDGLRFEKALGTWVVPFPSIDPQVVRRSAAALSRYGLDFRYGHYLQVKSLSRVVGLIGGVSAVFLLSQRKLTRQWLLSKKTPGEGPSPEERARGWFRVRFIAQGGGKRVVTEVRGGDPGYGETAKMLAESGMCLAFDRLPKRSGQLTPAVAMGNVLIERLQKAGIEFTVVEKNQ